jgi:RHS repeat-associated protein
VIPHEKQLFGGRRRIVKSWHRFYDPATGRYISADPIGLGGGINLYGYANQDALNFYDPTGEAVPAIVYPIIISIPIIAAIVANPPEVPDVDWPREEDECEEDPCNEILKKIREVMKELNRALLIKNHLALGGEIFTQRVLLTTVFMVVTICIVYLFAYLVDKYNEKSTEGKK